VTLSATTFVMLTRSPVLVPPAATWSPATRSASLAFALPPVVGDSVTVLPSTADSVPTTTVWDDPHGGKSSGEGPSAAAHPSGWHLTSVCA